VAVSTGAMTDGRDSPRRESEGRAPLCVFFDWLECDPELRATWCLDRTAHVSACRPTNVLSSTDVAFQEHLVFAQAT